MEISYPPYVKTQTITVESIYTEGIPAAPDGYITLGFRPYTKGERVLCTDGSHYVPSCGYGLNPCLVIQKIKRKVITFRQVVPTPSTIKLGQFYQYNGGQGVYPNLGSDLYLLDVGWNTIVFDRIETEE